MAIKITPIPEGSNRGGKLEPLYLTQLHEGILVAIDKATPADRRFDGGSHSPLMGMLNVKLGLYLHSEIEGALLKLMAYGLVGITSDGARKITLTEEGNRVLNLRAGLVQHLRK